MQQHGCILKTFDSANEADIKDSILCDLFHKHCRKRQSQSLVIEVRIGVTAGVGVY